MISLQIQFVQHLILKNEIKLKLTSILRYYYVLINNNGDTMSQQVQPLILAPIVLPGSHPQPQGRVPGVGPLQPQPQGKLARVKSAISRPLSWVGSKLGSVYNKGKDLGTRMRHPIATTKKDLFQEAPKVWHTLHKLLKIASTSPEQLTIENVQRIIDAILEIRDQKNILDSLGLNQTEFDNLEAVGELFLGIFDVTDPENYLPPTEAEFTVFKGTLINNVVLKSAAETMGKLLERQEGLVTHGLTLLDAALLDPQSGLLDQLKDKLTEGETSLLRRAFVKMKQELGVPVDQPLITGGMARLKEEFVHHEHGLVRQLIDALKALLGIHADEGLPAGLTRLFTAGEGSLLHQILTKAHESLLREAPKSWRELDQLVKQAIAAPQALTQDKAQQLARHVTAICLHQAPLEALGLTAPEIASLTGLRDLFHTAFNPDHNCERRSEELFNQLRANLATGGNPALLQQTSTVMGKLLERQEGTVVHALTLLDAALLDPQSGLLDRLQVKLTHGDTALLQQAFIKIKEQLGIDPAEPLIKGGIALLKDGVLNDQHGLFKQVIDKLKTSLGIAPVDDLLTGLNKKLVTEEQSLLNLTLTKVRDKIVGTDGLMEDLEKLLMRTAHPTIIECRQFAQEAQQAYLATPSDAQLRGHASKTDFLNALIEGLLQQSKTFFPQRPLTSAQKTELQAIHDHFNLFLDTAQPAPDEALNKEFFARATKLFDELTDTQTGVVGRVGSAFTRQLSQALEPYFTRLEQLPRTWKESLFGPPATGSSSIGTWLTGIAKMIKEQGVTAAGSSQVAMLLAMGIDKIVGQIRGQSQYSVQLGELETLLGSIKQVQTSGDWNALYEQVTRLASIFNSVTVSINGLHLPKIGVDETPAANPESIHYKNLQALQGAIKPVSSSSSENWKDKAAGEKQELIDNTTAFITLKVIYEKVCGIRVPDSKEFYVGMMRLAKTAADPKEELQKIFFEELDHQKITGFKYLIARFFYWFSNKFIHSRVQQATDAYFVEIYDYIEQQKQKRFAPLTQELLGRSSHYLANLNGAFEQVAATPGSAISGTLKEMLRKEMERPEHNDGHTTRDLYAGLAQSVIEKSSGNRFFSAIFKFFVGTSNEELIVREILDESVSSIRDPHGYTHALNTVICELLDDIWGILERSHHEESSAQPPSIPFSRHRKEELTSLVKSLFAVLRKTKCQTLEELRDLVKGQSTSENIKKAVDELFIKDVIEELTNLIGVSITSLLKEDQLQKLTYKFLHLANQAYTTDIPHTQEEARLQEQHMQDMLNRILRFSVEKAIDERFNASGEKAQAAVNQKIEDLKTKTASFATSTMTALTQLQGIDNQLSSEHRATIDRLANEALAFETDHQHHIAAIREMPMSTDDRDALLKKHKAIAELSKDLIASIVAIKGNANAIGNHQGFFNHLQTMSQEVTFVVLSLHNPEATEELFSRCNGWILSIEAHLNALSQLPALKPQIDQMKNTLKELSRSKVEVEKHHQCIRLMTECTTASISPIDQMIQLKSQGLAMSDRLDETIASLKRKVEVAVPTDLRGTWLSEINKLAKAASGSPEEATSKSALQHLAATALLASQTAMATERTKASSYGKAIKEAVDATHLLDADYVQKATESLKAAIQQAIPQCTQVQNNHAGLLPPITYVNASIVPAGIRSGATSAAKKLVFESIQERALGALDFIARDDSYYGALNHLALIPYMDSVGKGKKKGDVSKVVQAVKDRL